MTIKTYIELEVEVEFDRVPGQTQTRHDPGFEESIEITGVTILQNQSAPTLPRMIALLTPLIGSPTVPIAPYEHHPQQHPV